MATFEQGTHPYADEELVTGSALADLLGVSREAVSKAVRTNSGRLDQWKDSEGRARFHPELSVQQWTDRRASNYVTTANRAQRGAGFTNEKAQAVAHRGVTNPRAPGKATTREEPTDPEEADRHNLAMSRADRERYNARLLEIRIQEKEGQLVDKATFFHRAHLVGNAIKDQLNGLPPQVGPVVVAAVEEALVAGGVAAEVVRAALVRSNLEHVVREALRAGVVRSLRTLTSKSVEELLG